MDQVLTTVVDLLWNLQRHPEDSFWRQRYKYSFPTEAGWRWSCRNQKYKYVFFGFCEVFYILQQQFWTGRNLRPVEACFWSSLKIQFSGSTAKQPIAENKATSAIILSYPPVNHIKRTHIISHLIISHACEPSSFFFIALCMLDCLM